MAAQNGRGEVVLGDSHEYGDAIEPFDKAAIDDLILGYLATLPGRAGAADRRRAGTAMYAKHPTDALLRGRARARRHGGHGVGGAGMTLAFGLAEQVVQNTLGEA